jgi:hypothetical protein
MNAYGGVDLKLHTFLTLALDEGEWSASRAGPFTPGYPLDRRMGRPQSWSGHGIKHDIFVCFKYLCMPHIKCGFDFK